MESLGGLLSQMKDSQFKARSERIMQELLENPGIIELLDKHPELDQSQLTLHMGKLYQYAKDSRNCASCPGLERCPNDFPGHYTKLSVETLTSSTQIYEQKTPCNKQIAFEHETEVKSRIRSFYVDDRALNEGYNPVEMMTRDVERVSAVGRVGRYIEEVRANGLTNNGLYMVGPFGTGKTFLMSYLLNELAKSGYTGVIVYMPEFVEELKFMMQDNQGMKEMIETMKHADLLIFDDIGAENLNPWVRDHILGSILNYRMNRKPTFYTSNYDLAGLERHLSFTSKDGEEAYKGQRLMDRISPFVDVVQVKGSNQRRAQ